MSVISIGSVREHGTRYLLVQFDNGYVYDPRIPEDETGRSDLLRHIGRKTWCTPEIAAKLAEVCAETTKERQCHEA